MSFNDYEVSRESGRPVRLYQFQRGIQRFNYTSADRVVNVGGTDFAPSQVSDSGIVFSGQATADPLTVTLPADSEVSLMYRVLPPQEEIFMTIWDWHYGQNDFIVSFVGSVLGVKWPTANTAEVTVWSLTASLDRPGLRLCWQRGCIHSLYDNNCKVNPQTYKIDGLVSAYNGLTIIATNIGAVPDGWFMGGYVEWTDENQNKIRRGIQTHAASNLVLLGGTFGVSTGLPVSMFPGCVRTSNVCANKFNNLLNYGGATGMPGKSPFDGDPVF